MPNAFAEEIFEAVKGYIKEQRHSGTLKITSKKIRNSVEERLGYEKGELDSKEYQLLVQAAIEKVNKGSESDDGSSHSNDNISQTSDSDEEVGDSEIHLPPTKRKRVNQSASPSKPMVPSESKSSSSPQPRNTRKVKDKKQYKSRSIIDDSDEEMPMEERPSPRKVLVKSRGKNDSHQSRNETLAKGPSRKKVKLKQERTEEIMSVPKSKDNGDDPTVGSDGTQDPPKKPVEGVINSKKMKSTTKDSSNKHDETIKRYKLLIGACGFRKQYAKIFKDKGIEDSPGRQVECLKQILHEIGMRGRMSMDQAKKLRAQKELAEEMADVEEFSKSMLVEGRASRSNSKREEIKNEESGSNGGDSSEEEENPAPRRKNARKSIMAFLADQSDSE